MINNSLMSRIVVILIFVPLLVWIFLLGDITFLIFTEVIIGIATYEFYKMLTDKGYNVASNIGLGLAVVLPLLIYISQKIVEFRFDIGLFAVVSIFMITIRQIIKEKIKGSISEVSYTFFGIMYISYFFSYILLIRRISDDPVRLFKINTTEGSIWVLLAFVLIWTCDICAYIVGMNIGGKIFKRRLSPKISPNKSIEGSIGGIVGVFLVILWLNKFLESLNLNIFQSMVLALIVSVFAEIGDLVESKIKREFEVKDSGNLLGGHGGFLDRFDSALFVLPVFYYFLKFYVY